MALARWSIVACALVSACGHGAGPATTFRAPPRLPAPPPSDPTAFGHAYLEKVGGRLQGDWGAFLEDLRLRLPPTDPLNDGRLLVAIDCAVLLDGSLGQLAVASSGNPSFDRAAVEILRDAAPFAPPPAELASDDDTVHLHWVFARDRRQAGTAGARIDRVEWPIERAVPKLVDAGELAEAARRVAEAAAAKPAAPGLDALAEAVFDAAIVEAVGSSDVTVRRDAAAAIEAVHDRALEVQAVELARDAVDVDVRAHAIRAVGLAGGDDAKLLDLVIEHYDLPPPVTEALAQAMVAAGRSTRLVEMTEAWLVVGGTGPRPPKMIAAALTLLAAVRAPTMVATVRRLAAGADPITRGAACAALAPSAATAAAWAGIRRGLDDADATVRSACADAAGRAAAVTAVPRDGYARIVALLRDRDERVRAAAAIAAASVDPMRAASDLNALPPERSAAVRAALAAAWGRVPGETPAALVLLSGDNDAGVRASAVAALAVRDDAAARALAARMAPDPDARVRLAAVAAIAEADGLAGLVTDDDPQVRTAALDRDAQLRGRAAALAARAAALAAAPRGSSDRVRIARSWLLAR